MAGADEALNIATWLAGLIGLAEEGVPVLKNTNQHTHINEVKGIIGPGPFLIAVLEFELDVGRYPRRLNGGDICANNLRVGEVVGKIAGWKRYGVSGELPEKE